MSCKKLNWITGVLLLSAATVLGQAKMDQYRNATPEQLVERTDLTEAQLGDIQRYFQLGLKDEQKAKTLQQLIVARYPKGSTARFVSFHTIEGAVTAQDRIARAEAFLQAFPYNEWHQHPNGQEFIYYTTYRVLGSAYFDARQFNKFLDLTTPLNFKTENELYRWNVMRAIVFKTVGADTLLNISTRMINELIQKKDDSSYIEVGVFNAARAAANASEQMDNELNTHITLLHSMGRFADAKPFFHYLSPAATYGRAELNELHLDVLQQTGDQAAVQPFLENCMKANAMTPRMLDVLKEVYTAQHKDGNYDQYLAGLKSDTEQQTLLAEVKEHLTNQEYVPFAMEDPEGHLVRSSDWGNKIVVLDFWATWCKPCIAAFPGMQMLIDKYANDPQVVVYMVGTMQSGNYKEKSEGYIRQQGYRFHLLHDNIDKATGGQDAVFRSFVPFFHSSGIPRKVILKDGVMRYTAEGYSGSPSKLADELSDAIELLKAEQ
ncbi:hypothetical protein DCC81_17990 [Chitinophaga parva]|uniref:Thioredoxin domain-containing protein n=1 Tax=Chitinophaga parva TaxID=2169414 RepID=A0A2T7BIL9_9BACT|nr:TlpA disulfide reductase family protein [Chitinophaga parva]PUZ26130.1 hypothetical protein DCC81_17990 [Chitinophaga parva]